MSAQDRFPLWPWILGLAGLVPFAVFAYLKTTQQGFAAVLGASGFFFYAALILSFLGGVRWGAGMILRPEAPHPLVLTGSILPTVVAFLGLLLQMQNPRLALMVLGGGFVLLWLWDVVSSGTGGRRLPGWYAPLRTVLTAGVLASGAVMAFL